VRRSLARDSAGERKVFCAVGDRPPFRERLYASTVMEKYYTAGRRPGARKL
jgi:hypothetical protein